MTVESIPTSEVRWEPRPGTDCTDLVESFEELGQLHPVHVVPHADGGYVLVAGRRRMEAARRMRWKSIDACVVGDDASRITVQENLCRRQLTGAEAAHAIDAFKDRDSTTFVRPRHLTPAPEPADEEPPEEPTRVFTESEHTQLCGLIEDQVEWAEADDVREVWETILEKLEAM